MSKDKNDYQPPIINSDHFRPDLEHKMVIVGFSLEGDEIIFKTLEPNMRVFQVELAHLIGDQFNVGKEKLSRQEARVLVLIANGYTNPEIAKLLKLSPRTTETYWGNIKKKLHLNTRHEMTAYVKAFMDVEESIVLSGIAQILAVNSPLEENYENRNNP